MEPAKATLLLQSMQPASSLDEPFAEDMERASVLPDVTAPSPDARLIARDRVRSAARALARLNPRERRVLRLRFGLAGDREHTLQEVGDELGLTRKRVRQIEKYALTKLRRRAPRTAGRAAARTAGRHAYAA